MPGTRTGASSSSSAAALPTEAVFRKRLKTEIAESATVGCASRYGAELDPDADPALFVERDFQRAKLRKRVLEANAAGALLDHEVSDDVLKGAAEEAKRQVQSRGVRTRAAARQLLAHHADPPKPEEMHKSCIYVVAPANDRTLLEAVARHEARIVKDVWLATMFIAGNPFDPGQIVTLAAVLRGAWVLTPSTFAGSSQTALKYLSAFKVRRRIWFSDAFRAEHVMLWRVVLELLKVCTHNWELLPGPQAWATARAHAEKKKQPASVLAVVATSEPHNAKTHVFQPNEFIAFITICDRARTSLGLAGM